MGRRNGVVIYASILLSSYAHITIGLFIGLPTLSSLALLSVPLSANSVQIALRHYEKPTSFATAMLHTIVLYLTITTIFILSYLL